MEIFYTLLAYLTSLNEDVLKQKIEYQEYNPLHNLILNRYENLEDLRFKIDSVNQVFTHTHLPYFQLENLKDNHKWEQGYLIMEGKNIQFFIHLNEVIFKSEKTMYRYFNEMKQSSGLALALKKGSNLNITKEDLQKPKEDLTRKIRNKIMETGFAKFIQTPKRNLELMSFINRTIAEIQQKEYQIKELERELRNEEEKLIFGGVSSEAKNFIEYVNNHDKIKDIEVRIDSGNRLRIKITTHPLIAFKFDRSYLMRSHQTMFNLEAPELRKALKELAENKAQIIVGPYEIKLSIDPKNMNYSLNPLSQLRNPHESIGCLGTAREDITRAKQNGEVFTLFSILMEYLTSINFGDAGSSSFPKYCKVVDMEGETLWEKKPS